eukprot:TRINITY_DN104648_c0_g1_i1.p1 TRINITY_DN104648_c0_g1~~TRINITY_DN104648_c0_g1_i1.p1  ORF type:complete len:508 (-),score=58.49 TRINITY_DN104648_c0_g1_i1:47-1570(-)
MAAHVSQQFQQQGIFVKQEWIEQCVDFIRSQNTLPATTFTSTTPSALSPLVGAVFEQFLVADLRLIADKNPQLPELADCNKDTNKPRTIKGPFVVQIEEFEDISESSRDSTERMIKKGSTQEQKKSGLRCLKMSCTDGNQCFSAMEDTHCAQLLANISPGCKMQLTSVEVLKGLVLIGPSNIIVLGGEVEELQATNQSKLEYRAVQIQGKNYLLQQRQNSTQPQHNNQQQVVTQPPITAVQQQHNQQPPQQQQFQQHPPGNVSPLPNTFQQQPQRQNAAPPSFNNARQSMQRPSPHSPPPPMPTTNHYSPPPPSSTTSFQQPPPPPVKTEHSDPRSVSTLFPKRQKKAAASPVPSPTVVAPTPSIVNVKQEPMDATVLPCQQGSPKKKGVPHCCWTYMANCDQEQEAWYTFRAVVTSITPPIRFEDGVYSVNIIIDDGTARWKVYVGNDWLQEHLQMPATQFGQLSEDQQDEAVQPVAHELARTEGLLAIHCRPGSLPEFTGCTQYP